MEEFSIQNILAAKQRITGRVVRTPLITNIRLDQQLGGSIFLKCENLQHAGSFKMRGAFNRMSLIPEADRAKGVVAYSPGNHAQGVALTGKLLGIKTTIFMPKDAPKMKIENTRNYGADVFFFERGTGEREVLVKDFVAKTGATFISPFNDLGVMAGQGTAGVEIYEQLDGRPLDQVIIPCSGGGLSAGIGTAIKHFYPHAQIYVVEPQGYHSTGLSLQKGEIQPKFPTRPPSICDALLKEVVGDLTFAANYKNKAIGVVVSDAEAADAMRFSFQNLKQVLEPGGAVGLAAVLTGKVDTKNKTTAIILSGGNVDTDLFVDVLNKKI